MDKDFQQTSFIPKKAIKEKKMPLVRIFIVRNLQMAIFQKMLSWQKHMLICSQV
jgi:hypothetical protein